MELTIEKLVYGGDGLARLPADEHGRGKAVFVPFVLEGERLEAVPIEERPGFTRARLERMLAASPRRVEPACPYFTRCGGCHYQHAAYEEQLRIKASILKENLARIAKTELPPGLVIHPSPPWTYRNRTRVKVRCGPPFAAGYYRFGSHELLAVEECPISSPLLNRALAAVWQLGRAGKIPQNLRELELFANADDAQLAVELYGDDRRAAPLPDWAKALAHDLGSLLPELASVSIFELSAAAGRHEPAPQQGRVVLGPGSLTYATAGAKFRVSGGAFFQTNRHLTDELVAAATAGRSGTLALDLYAGVGLFATFLSWNFERVIAVEWSPISHADLQYNAPGKVKAVRASTEYYLEKAGGKVRPELVVVDPPRSGLGEKVVRGLAALAPPRISYVSCDPATLARDLRLLLASGYAIEQAHLVDLFPQSYHLESVFHLARQ